MESDINKQKNLFLKELNKSKPVTSDDLERAFYGRTTSGNDVYYPSPTIKPHWHFIFKDGLNVKCGFSKCFLTFEEATPVDNCKNINGSLEYLSECITKRGFYALNKEKATEYVAVCLALQEYFETT